MLQRLPPPVLGTLTATLLVFNTVLWALPVYVCIVLKVLLPPRSKAYAGISRRAAGYAQDWATANAWFVDHLMTIEWDIRIPAGLKADGQYLVCSNHQTWNDIFVLMKAFGRRAPFFKFFLKRQLIWIPVLGLVWWGLDYPFMHRHTAEEIARNPSLRGQDLDTTRRACERYRQQPVLILNFLEGTRYTAAKHRAQQSPYRHLLKPKAGGFAFTLAAFGQQLNSLLDVTIVYPGGARGFWPFLSGRVRRVIVDIRQLEVPPDFYAPLSQQAYENDPEFRRRFQDWIAQLWREKDQRIEALLAQAGT